MIVLEFHHRRRQKLPWRATQAASGAMVIADYQCGGVIISFALSFISSYNAVCFADIHRHAPKFTPRYFPASIQLIFMSIALGGGAIWSMHFTGMAALTLETDTGESITLRYNLGTTILSLLIAMGFVYVGLLISTLDRVYTKDRDQIFEMILADLTSLARQDKPTLYRLALLKGIDYLSIGGVITGGGVCVMHYTGMLALNADPDLTIQWKIGLVAFSVIIAMVASTTAFWILFRLLPLFPNWESLRLASAFIMAIAVCGMHYTGMTAATYHTTEASGLYFGSLEMDSNTARLAAITSSLIMNWIFSMVIQSELRYLSFTRTKELEYAQKQLQSSANATNGRKEPSRYYSEGDTVSRVIPIGIKSGHSICRTIGRTQTGTIVPLDKPLETGGDVISAPPSVLGDEKESVVNRRLMDIESQSQ